MSTSVITRINPILFAIFAAAISHNLFFILLPISLRDSGWDASSIGSAMAMFAFGGIFGGLFGSRAVLRAGHIRAFATMAAALAIVSVIHSYSNDITTTAVLRFLAGFCFYTGFLTLESWLNVLTDQSNRGKVYSIYQICFALGFGSAPFLLNLFDKDDPRLYGLICAFLCVSLIIMAMSKMPAPELPSRSRPASLRKLWNYSPSATISCCFAGLINTASISLISLYAYDRGFMGIWLAVILGSYQLGGLITQFPTGWLADRYDKRSVAVGLMVVGVISNSLIVLDYYVGMDNLVLTILFLISGGSGVALFPLAVTQMFDHIDLKEAMPVTSAMQIIMGTAGVIGPIVAGYLMHQFASVALYYYLVVIHASVAVFLLARRFIRRTKLEPTAPYRVTTQPTSMGASVLDPHIEYKQTQLRDPELKLLVAALAQHPKDPKVLIEAALENSTLTPEDVAMNLVLALPKQSENMMKCLVELYPAHRVPIARSLHDLFILHKTRINALIETGLKHQASEAEKREISSLIHSVAEEIQE